MKITDAPTPIATPFAQNGTRNDIPDTDPGFTGDTAGRAAFATGFPEITMRPIAAGGVPPFGADFNGILYALSNAVRFYGAGGHYKFNADFASKIGGYPMGATVQATDNMGHWLNVVEANSINPESELSTGWLPLADHNGTATVTLTASTALTPLQAAKANLRFTGTPTGNVTVTFPAWTKRYSIINDCAGDSAIICTTGNGESISIKNGAKYEVGCDGKNLTLSTVNATQVFAEANKNISAIEAPTVQQLLNALGSAAAHAASDFDSAGSAQSVQTAVDQLINSLGTAAKKNIDDFDLKGAAQTVQSNLEEFSQTLGSASKHAHEDYLDINNYLYTYCSGVTIYYTPRQTHVVSGTELIVNDSGFYYISGALRAWAHDGGGIGSNGTWGGILTVNGTGKGFQSGAMNALNDSNNRDATVPITGVQYLNKGDTIGVGFYCGGDGRQWDYAVTVATLFAKKVGK